MRYIITRPSGETYRIAGQPQGSDDLEAAKRIAADLASQRWNLCPLGVWDCIAYAPICTVQPNESAQLCAPAPAPKRRKVSR
jgi:hypothetical protein